MQNLFDLQNRVIVITGATGVLAGSAAEYLLDQGARIVCLGRTQNKIDTLLSKFSQHKDRSLAFACDVQNSNSLEKIRDQILNTWNRIDALINAVGGNQPGATLMPGDSLFDMDINAYNQVLSLNLQGTLIPTMIFGRPMVESGKGVIVNFSSMAADRALTRVIGYSNAKAAVNNLTQWLAVEFAKKTHGGVRVNAVAPGFFLSEQNKNLLTNNDGSLTQRGQTIVDKTPFARFGNATELHGALHYLLSDASAFTTGIILPVDGGFSAFSGV